MFIRWTKVNRANIPEELRTDLERYGEAVVAQILGRPYTHSDTTPGVPKWAGDGGSRGQALDWLREQHNKEERHRDIGEAMEVAILIFVGVEAVPTIVDWVARLLRISAH